MKFFHTGKNGQKGGTTVGYQWLDKEQVSMLVTFARCSDSTKSTDVFNCKKGRLICTGRMEKGLFKKVEKPKELGKYEFLLKLVEENDKQAKDNRGKKLHTTGARQNRIAANA